MLRKVHAEIQSCGFNLILQFQFYLEEKADQVDVRDVQSHSLAGRLANLEQILDEVFQTVGFLVQDADVSGFFLFRTSGCFSRST